MSNIQDRLREAAEEFSRGSDMEVLLFFAADRIDHLQLMIAHLEQAMDAVDARHREVRDAIAAERDELRQLLDAM